MTSSRRPSIALLLAAALLVAACDAGSAGGGPGGSSPDTVAPSSDAPPSTVTPSTDSPSVSEVASAAETPPATEGGRSAELTVVSDDGTLTVVFPAGSFAADVEPSIETVAPEGDGPPTYRLLPDTGSDLPEPADVELRLDAEALDAIAPDVGSEATIALGLTDASGGTGRLRDVTLAVEELELVMRAELIRLTSLTALDGRSLRFEQVMPGETTPVSTDFTVDVQFTDSGEIPVPVVAARWFGGDPWTPVLRERCPDEPGTFASGGYFLLDIDTGVAIWAPVTTECVEERTEVALDLQPPGFDAEVYEGEAYVRADPDGSIGFGMPADQIPDGGSIGLDFFNLDQSGFLECIIDRREFDTIGPRCVLRDSSFQQLDLIELEETTEVIDGEQIVWATAPQELGVQLLDVFIGFFGLDETGLARAAEITLRRFLEDGTLFAAGADRADPAWRELAGGFRQGAD